MGITIHYSGKVKYEDEIQIVVEKSEKFAQTNNWKIEKIQDNHYKGIIIYPHIKCETINLLFDKKFKMDSFTKTVSAPFDIHMKIVEMLYSLKQHFSKLIVDDESGFWYEYIENLTNSSKHLIIQLPELNEKQLLEYDQINYLIQNEDEEDDEAWFWKKDYQLGELHFPTIRDFIRVDLSKDMSKLISLSEVSELAKELEIRWPLHINEKFPEQAIILLSEVWALLRTKGDQSKIKSNKCRSFSWTISEGCFGFHGGYLNQNHRKAVKYLNNFIENEENIQHSKNTLRFFYGLLDQLKLIRQN